MRANSARRGGSYQNQSYRNHRQNPNNHYHQGSSYQERGRRGLAHASSSMMRRSRSRSLPPSGPRAESSRRLIERADVDTPESINRADEPLLGRKSFV